MDQLIMDILAGKAVREAIDEHCVENLQEASIDLGDEPTGAEVGQVDPSAEDGPKFAQDDETYRHLFVRRWKKGADAPYKRSKMMNAVEALQLYFDWVNKYRQEKVEIWSDVASDVQNFYDFCIKKDNLDSLKQQFVGSRRLRAAGVKWLPVLTDLKKKAQKSGSLLVGTLYPFECDAPED